MKKSSVVILLALVAVLLLGAPSAHAAAPTGALKAKITLSFPYQPVQGFVPYPAYPAGGHHFRFTVSDVNGYIPVPMGWNVNNLTIDDPLESFHVERATNGFQYVEEFMSLTVKGQHKITVKYLGSPLFAPVTQVFVLYVF